MPISAVAGARFTKNVLATASLNLFARQVFMWIKDFMTIEIAYKRFIKCSTELF